MFAIIRKWPVWFVISLVGIIIGQRLFWTHIRLSIDFTGGIRTVFTTSESVSDIKAKLDSMVMGQSSWGINVDDVNVQVENNLATALFVVDSERNGVKTDDIVDAMVMSEVIMNEDDVQETASIGASIGSYMKKSAFRSLIIGLLCICVYTLFAFSGIRRYISPGLLAGVTLYTLLFDISLVCGVYGFFMMMNPTIRIDAIFVVALLTVIGYSINDTIIIFDRIRENARLGFMDGEHEENESVSSSHMYNGKKQKKKKHVKKKHHKADKGAMVPTYYDIFENSVWQVMKRSIGTSLSTLVAVIAMAIFGNDVMRIFAYTLIAGVIAGTYSSIFVAAPLAYKLNGKS